MDVSEELKSRGKRTLAKQMLAYEAVVMTSGIFSPEALVVGEFLAPYIIPAAIGLFLGDAYFYSTYTRVRPS